VATQSATYTMFAIRTEKSPFIDSVTGAYVALCVAAALFAKFPLSLQIFYLKFLISHAVRISSSLPLSPLLYCLAKSRLTYYETWHESPRPQQSVTACLSKYSHLPVCNHAVLMFMKHNYINLHFWESLWYVWQCSHSNDVSWHSSKHIFRVVGINLFLIMYRVIVTK
jgi:hypothetical protein